MALIVEEKELYYCKQIGTIDFIFADKATNIFFNENYLVHVSGYLNLL